MNKIYKKINDATLLNLIDTQEKVIATGLGQVDKILAFAKKVEKKP